MPSFDAYWLIPLGIAVYLLIPVMSLRRLHRKVARLQKPLDQLAKDVNGLLAAEETRFMKDFRANEAKVQVTPRAAATMGGHDDVAEAVMQGATPLKSTNGVGHD